jgi:hypothetical protein
VFAHALLGPAVRDARRQHAVHTAAAQPSAVVERQVRRKLVLSHFAFPEAAAVPANIPVRQLIYCEVAHTPGCLRNIVDFHELPVPADLPFPRVNDTEAFRRQLTAMRPEPAGIS